MATQAQRVHQALDALPPATRPQGYGVRSHLRRRLLQVAGDNGCFLYGDETPALPPDVARPLDEIAERLTSRRTPGLVGCLPPPAPFVLGLASDLPTAVHPGRTARVTGGRARWPVHSRGPGMFRSTRSSEPYRCPGSAPATRPSAGGSSEMTGMALAAVVLVTTFGSPAAAGLPPLTALAGAGSSMAAITALSSTFGLSATSGTPASVLGLAVGIDYARFVVSRYREERAKGHAPREAAGLAAGTAGSAVVFAGSTVVTALAGLLLIPIRARAKCGCRIAGPSGCRGRMGGNRMVAARDSVRRRSIEV